MRDEGELAAVKTSTTLVIDCETTGLTMPSLADLKQQPRIIELAAVRIERGKIACQFEQLINPGCDISPEITKITGISNEDVKNAPFFSAVLPTVIDFFKGSSTLIAHNAPFDVACLEYELRRAGHSTHGFFPETIICTVQEYVHEFGRRPKLTELYERKMGKPLEQTHRALDDVLALAEIVLKEKLA